MEILAHAQPPGFVRSGGYQLHLIYPNLLIYTSFTHLLRLLFASASCRRAHFAVQYHKEFPYTSFDQK